MIDAICIDQSHTEERNHQVAMMGDIYSNATCVVVWLGPESPVAAKLRNTCNFELSTMRKTLHQSEKRQELTRVLRELAGNEYWRRLWILQEYLLAQNITIWYGPHNICVGNFRYLLRKTVYDCSAIKILQGRHYRHFSSSRMSFDDIVTVHGCILKCSDKRDGIYALLSLLDKVERIRLSVIPDYSLTPIKILQRVLPKLHSNSAYKPRTTFTLCIILGLGALDYEFQKTINRTESLNFKRYYAEITMRLNGGQGVKERRENIIMRQRHVDQR